MVNSSIRVIGHPFRLLGSHLFGVEILPRNTRHEFVHNFSAGEIGTVGTKCRDSLYVVSPGGSILRSTCELQSSIFNRAPYCPDRDLRKVCTSSFRSISQLRLSSPPMCPYPSRFLACQFHLGRCPAPSRIVSKLPGTFSSSLCSKPLFLRAYHLNKAEKFIKLLFGRPMCFISSTFSRYGEAIGLHIDAFWKRNTLKLFVTGGIILCVILWRTLFTIAGMFIEKTEGIANYGFLMFSAAIVTFSGIYMHSRLSINPDKVYRMAMRKLNTSAGILEVMGAPLSGIDVRAYVMAGGGGFTLKNLQPRLKSRRCFLIFPIRGSEMSGIVNVEVKQNKGQYEMKLLAVDLGREEQRLFLVGNEEEYKVGGGLISELKAPLIKAVAASKEFDDLDRFEAEVTHPEVRNLDPRHSKKNKLTE